MNNSMRKPTICVGENKGADQLISAFVFATRIVPSLYFLNPKFPASNYGDGFRWVIVDYATFHPVSPSQLSKEKGNQSHWTVKYKSTYILECHAKNNYHGILLVAITAVEKYTFIIKS